MKTAIALILGAALVTVACDKKDQPATTASTAAAKTTTSATPAPTPSAAAAPAPSASAAEKADEKKADDDDEQEGLEKGEVIVGYIQDSKDEGQCAALAAKESEKAKFDKAKVEEVAKMMKGKVVDKCPTENVQGTCRAMGMLVNYIGPKYTPETAKKDCTKNHGKWFD